MQEPGLDILLDDDCLLAINKPSGLSTQAPRQFDSVERRVRGRRDEIDGPGSYIGVPHRLDRPASGVLVVAKTPRAARHISRQFERRQIDKTYWACVSGNVEPAEETWRDYVRKLLDVPKVEIVAADTPGALEAVLHYRVVGQTQYGSLLEIKLQTGRTHQIRVQAASRGHPVLGDALYGSTVPFGPQTADERERAIALHARSLTFRHPTTHDDCTVTADVPDAWKALRLVTNAERPTSIGS
jgi:23S rRNA pseudouridine1911/1915/1917 synthase